jgi:hypothetical protein
MDYTDYLWLKALALLVIVFVWQFIRGLNGLPVHSEQPDTSTEPHQDSEPKQIGR